MVPTSAKPSKHLASRAETGRILRAGTVSTIELRAAMIIGSGSASWTMVRDLAARLPIMVLPRWLKNHSHPIAIDDVIAAILLSLRLETTESNVFEIPGPERIDHKELLGRVVTLMGRKRPMVSVPVLSPRLSSYWIALVTRTDLSLAKELVEGVRDDLDPSHSLLWDHVEHTPMSLDDSIKLAFVDATDVQTDVKQRRRAETLGQTYKGKQ